jgi:hypothetical protein
MDPLDKLIAAVQGGDVHAPVPMPPGAILARDGTVIKAAPKDPNNIPVMNFPAELKERDRVLLWYRQIFHSHYPGDGQPANSLGAWQTCKLAISTSLSMLEERDRINKVIEIALTQDIGRYPKVLFAFEWFDVRMGQTLRQEIKDGFVRG